MAHVEMLLVGLVCVVWCVPIGFAEVPSPGQVQFGGCGGVYFLVDPGTFWVEVHHDARREGEDRLVRVVLAGPDRAVLFDKYVSSEDEPVRIEAEVPARGIYALNITMPGDRYGTRAVWGFETNAERYVVETSRGHRDAAHEEPLVLARPERSGEVCFRPEDGAFSVELTGYPKGADAPTVLNGSGEDVATLDVDTAGAATVSVSEEVPRGEGPWRLRLPAFAGTLHIDGVTRWPRGSDYPNFSLWTPDRESWFPLHENRWLIAPYHQHVYAGSIEGGMATFRVHNDGDETRTFELSVDPVAEEWPVKVEAAAVTVPPGDALPVRVRFEDGTETRAARVRVTPRDTPSMSTYATLTVHPGEAPAEEPLDLPLALRPYEHENVQLGYLPDYPLANQVYFDGENAPYIAAGASVFRWEDGWREANRVASGSDSPTPFRLRSTKVAFDEENNPYLLGTVEGSPALVYSTDQGGEFQSVSLPGNGVFDIAQFSGHNASVEPPPFVRYTQTARDPDRIWRRINTLDLFLPARMADGTIAVGDPVRVSDQCIGFSAHSGIPSSVVARDGKVHVAWGEATDPEADVPGVPTYVATYDRVSGKLSSPTLVGYGPPANDVHNTPCITMDSKGYLHVLIGTHGRAFRYARSLEPNTAAGGWTAAEELGAGLRQTYVGLVCGPDDTLHCVFRLWRDDGVYHPGGSYATLAYMRKRPGEAWSEPRLLVVAAFSDYSIFYHRLTIDRSGRLFLSYDYWSTYWFYRNDQRGDRRALMMSGDGGDTWRMVGGDDLRR